jgi:thiamine-monophosphate kinase
MRVGSVVLINGSLKGGAIRGKHAETAKAVSHSCASYITQLKQGVDEISNQCDAPQTMKVGELGEDRLLNQLRLGKAVFAGTGDDCAIVEISGSKTYLVLKTDCVVEGVHFVRGTNASAVGWKAMMRPLSDFAAASGIPRFALITLIVPEQTEVAWVRGLYRGLHRAGNCFDVAIVGGETSNTPGPIAISVSVIGFVEKSRAASRRGGKTGDDLFVTGRLGGALKQKHLKFVARIAESRWLTKNFSIHAMMDLSDGLGADLPRLARSSKVGFKIELENLPVRRGATIDDAISEGEDYELLFAISPGERNRLERKWQQKFPKLPLTRIGSLNGKSTTANRKLPRGYIHFQQSD